MQAHSLIAPAFADSGCSGNYLAVKDDRWLRNLKVNPNPIKVTVANGQVIESTHTGTLNVPGIGPMQAHVLPGLDASLLSISALVDLGLDVLFDQCFVRLIRKSDKFEVFQGSRDSTSGLWFIDLAKLQESATLSSTAVTPCSAPIVDPTQYLHIAAPAIRLTTADDTIDFWHKTFGSPAVSTFIDAISKGWIKLPGITAALVRRHPPQSIDTSLGHLHATRQGIRSTKTHVPSSTSTEEPPERTSKPLIFQSVYECTGRMHSDAAGRFPIKSINNKLYMIIFYSEDSNFIHVETTASRSGPDLLAAFKRAVTFFSSRNCDIRFARMDNECSNATKEWAYEEHIDIELVPPGRHRTNYAERNIQTWKNHFISILAGVDPDCPTYLWDFYTEQAELTLNLMRPSPSHPMLSAWEGLCGKFDINSTPLAPLGTKVVIHEPSSDRTSWAQHGEVGFYVGRALLHYRCFSIWVVRTRMVRISDTIAWHPLRITLPGSASIRDLTAAVEDMSALLKNILGQPALIHTHGPAVTVSTQLLKHYADVKALESLFRSQPSIPIAPALIPSVVDPSGSQQRVRDRKQRVPSKKQKAPSKKQKASSTNVQSKTEPTLALSQPTVTLGPTSIIRPPPRPRSHNSYDKLSDYDISRTNKQTVKCVGRQFSDTVDPADTQIGIVDCLVRHKQSRKLAFQYWDPTVHSAKPKKLKDFLYLDVKYGRESCKWTPVPLSARIAIDLDAAFLNRGPTVSQKRNARRRGTEPAPWYHNLIHRANAAVSTTVMPPDLFAFTAQDLNADGTRLTSTSALHGPDKERWMKAHGEEIIRLVDSETGVFIHRKDMPSGRKASYYNPQCKIKIKEGVEEFRVRGTIGGDQLDYPGITAAYTAALETIRLLLNAVVSEGASFLTADIKDFYLGTPLERFEYMRISLKHIPIDIQIKYNLQSFEHNGYVLMEIRKGIYGLKQAGKLAQDRLIMHLAKHGYSQCVSTPCLFRHKSNGVAFTLVVDDFLIKYSNREAADHLLAALRELYILKDDFATTQKYVGITLSHNMSRKTIHMSMPGYVQKALVRFKRLHIKGANSPILYIPPKYGRYSQEVYPDQDSKPLTVAQLLELQEIVGVFLFYARAVDPLMITAINKIGSSQADATTNVFAQINRFIAYASRFPNSAMCIRASDMKLYGHSDASYLSEPDSRSRAGGYLFLGECKPGGTPNAAIQYFSVIISTVVSSATEAEYAALFMTGQSAVSIRHTLADLGYPQGVTNIVCDNKCAVGIANKTLKQKRSKTIDMRFHWIRDQVALNTFCITWLEGRYNLADFFTKAHPVHHHLTQSKLYAESEPHYDPENISS